MKALIFIVMVILFTNFTSEVEASNDNVIDSSRIAIQDSELTTSPFDFKAQAKALGMQTFSEKTAIEGTRTTELDNQFDDRMAKAQEAWIQLTKPDSITAEAVSKFGEDIEKFVQLETEVEWSVPHKIAFLEFRKRLSQIKPAFFSQQQKLAAISYFHLMQKKQISAHSIPVELSEAIQDLSLRMVSFSELPPEVDVVFVDGHSYSRSELQFPLITSSIESQEIRITAVSNSHWPVTLLLRSSEKNLNLENRLKGLRPILENPIACSAPVPFSWKARWLVRIEEGPCLKRLLDAEPLESMDFKETNFRPQTLDPDPFRDRAPINPLPKIKPWVWVAIGGLALSALVITQENKSRNQSASREPVHRSGW